MTTRNNRLPILPALVAWLAAALVSATAAPLPPPPVDPNAVLYVSNRSLAIQKFDAHGASLGTLNTTSTAYGLAGDSAGNIYASSNNGHVIKMYTPGGGTSIIANANTVIAGSHGFDPLGMAIDAAGNLFVANPVPNFPGEILKFTPDGQGHFTPSVFANSSSYLAQPYDLAFDSGGNLYVTNFDSNSNSIAKFTPLGAGSIFAQSANIYQPTGLAIDGSDNIFVASFNHDAIWKYGSDGSDLGAFAQDNPNSPQFLNAPIGLAFDSVGNLYAADRQSNTIEKFDQFGSHSAFAHLSLPESILIQSNLALPEPSSLVLAALGFLGLAVWGKRLGAGCRKATSSRSSGRPGIIPAFLDVSSRISETTPKKTAKTAIRSLDFHENLVLFRPFLRFAKIRFTKTIRLRKLFWLRDLREIDQS